MKRTISAVDARKRLGEILESVYYRGDEVVIERAGKIMAVVVPPDRYAAMEKNWDRILSKIEIAHERSVDVPIEVLQKEIDEAVKEVQGTESVDSSIRGAA